MSKMSRSSSECHNVVVPNYLKPTVCSVAQRHPRAFKSTDYENFVTFGHRSSIQIETPPKRKHRVCRSETPNITIERGGCFFSKRVFESGLGLPRSRTKQEEKETRETYGKDGLQKTLEERKTKRVDAKSLIRASSALSDVHSIADSALSEMSEVKKPFPRAARPKPLSIVPETSKEVVKRVGKDSTTRQPRMAAMVLSILFRMNNPKPVVHDLFDLVVTLNNQQRMKKKEMDEKQKDEKKHVQRGSKGGSGVFCIELLRDLSFASLLQLGQKKAFLIAFPLIVLRLTAHFPSLLNTIFAALKGSWRPSFFMDDFYFLPGLIGGFSPLSTILSYF